MGEHKSEHNAGLLIAALVAIVAVVGLVILFRGSGSQTGAEVMRLPYETCVGDYWEWIPAKTEGGYWYCSTNGAKVTHDPEAQTWLS